MELESITESPFLNAYKRFVLKEAKKEAIAADMEAKAAPMVNKINQPEAPQAEDEDDEAAAVLPTPPRVCATRPLSGEPAQGWDTRTGGQGRADSEAAGGAVCE